jgi:carboxymethylenebutenolidase
MTQRVSFLSASGESLSGELALPEGAEKAPTLVLVQEWWGVNDHIRSLADRFAREGFVVLAPDLYHGKTTKDPSEAGRLMTALDTLAAVDDIRAATTFLKAHPRSNGKIGVVGFCMGGALTFAAGCHVEGLSAIVPFYGLPVAEKVDFGKLTAPVMAHFASRDEWASASRAEAIQHDLEKRGRSMVLHVYEADHAFMNDTRPEVYDPKNAALAWERTVAFFKMHLA